MPASAFCALNGGPQFPHSGAVSFMIETEDQARDRPALGCDRVEWRPARPSRLDQGPLGVSWQITPKRVLELITDPNGDRARPTMQAMMQISKIDIAALEGAAAAAMRR